jgi:NAD-dependent deacetylase
MSIEAAIRVLTEAADRNDRITILTGAGISAESGIPTFRGPEGFWTVGSREYYPQEMATLAMFGEAPESVWAWYLYRMGLCQKARPNPGHRALVSMESALGDRFTLITQNVDNLHIVAGSSPSRTLQIHGNIFRVRCASACSDEVFALPAGLPPKKKGEGLSDKDSEQLRCRTCGGWLRPHVLWFDETYNERHYRFRTALQKASESRLLITVGTAGATTLPNHIVHLVVSGGGRIIDINVAGNPFGDLASRSDRGVFVNRPSSEALVALARVVGGESS